MILQISGRGGSRALPRLVAGGGLRDACLALLGRAAGLLGLDDDVAV
jgi:hypothetical protein